MTRLARRISIADLANPNWSPVGGGRRPLICWETDVEQEIGPENAFDRLSERMLRGDFYPPDVIQFLGRFRRAGRNLQPGDRIVQRARLFPLLGWPVLWSVAEVFIAEKTGEACQIGYVTTNRHFGRGIWRATLERRGDRLFLRIASTAGPGSWQFWLGLPYARHLQIRSRRRAFEDFSRAANAPAE